MGAISGIGGGVILKPVFDLCFGMPASLISFFSGCTVLAMTVVSLLCSWGGEVRVDSRRGTLLGLGAAAGGLVGRILFDLLRGALQGESGIAVAQNAVMVVLTLGVLVYILLKKKIKTKDLKNPAICLFCGLLLGLLGAFLGIGGGPINLIVLYYFFSMDTKTAALNSLYIIFFSQLSSLLSLVFSGKIPLFDPLTLGVMILGGVLGGIMGRGFSRRLSLKNTDRLFMAVLVTVIGISFYNVLQFLP